MSFWWIQWWVSGVIAWVMISDVGVQLVLEIEGKEEEWVATVVAYGSCVGGFGFAIFCFFSFKELMDDGERICIWLVVDG